jgi:putative peptidoglycan lipid II flippase
MSNSILKSSAVMAVATFCSRILGLVREQLMALYFGASGLTDAFLVAYRIPNLLRDLLAEGAFSSAFVPTITEANQESAQTGRKLLWELFFILGSVTAVLSVLIFIFAQELITVFAPSFLADPEKFQLTVTMTRIMCPFLFFISLAALFMGALNSLKVFFVPALAPATYNLASIFATIFLAGFLRSQGHEPVLCLGWGALLGGFLQMIVQLPLIIKRGYGPVWPSQLFSKRANKVILLLGPGLVGFAATQINLLVNTILATGAAVGATSWLNYAFRLFQLPVGILSVSIGNSNLVHFSSSWKAGKKEEAVATLSSAYFLSFLSVMPAMVLLYVYSEEVINLIFERGRFSRASTIMTASALRMYVLGLPLYSLYKIWVPTFYAIDRQKIPVLSSLLSIVVNILFCWSMTPLYGFSMLALGTTLSMLLNCMILGFMLNKDLRLGWRFFLNLRLFKLMGASLLMVIVSLFIQTQLHVKDASLLTKIILLSCVALASTSVFVGAIYFLGERQGLSALASRIFGRLKKR